MLPLYSLDTGVPFDRGMPPTPAAIMSLEGTGPLFFRSNYLIDLSFLGQDANDLLELLKLPPRVIQRARRDRRHREQTPRERA